MCTLAHLTALGGPLTAKCEPSITFVGSRGSQCQNVIGPSHFKAPMTPPGPFDKLTSIAQLGKNRPSGTQGAGTDPARPGRVGGPEQPLHLRPRARQGNAADTKSPRCARLVGTGTHSQEEIVRSDQPISNALWVYRGDHDYAGFCSGRSLRRDRGTLLDGHPLVERVGGVQVA